MLFCYFYMSAIFVKVNNPEAHDIIGDRIPVKRGSQPQPLN